MELLEPKQNTIAARKTAESHARKLAKLKEPLEAQIAELTAAWEETNSVTIETANKAAELAADMEEGLRRILIETYEANPTTKQFGNGLSVRVNTQYNIDEAKGVEWAIAHEMPNLLKVNLTPYKKLASIQDLDFVEKTEKVSAVISWDEEKGK